MNIFSSFMSSFQELKGRLKSSDPSTDRKSESQPNTPTPKTVQKTSKAEDPLFEYEECRFLLNMIANTDFKGQDVQMVYNIALKLQTLMQDNYTENTDE